MTKTKTFKCLGLAAIVMAVLFTSGCEDESEDTKLPVDERIIGQWTIKESVLFGAKIPGDGSYLTFETCGTETCTGIDFEATEGTSGTFEYELNEEGTSITIDDHDGSAGGSYSGTYTIESFTNSSMTLKTTTIFGDFIMKFSK